MNKDIIIIIITIIIPVNILKSKGRDHTRAYLESGGALVLTEMRLLLDSSQCQLHEGFQFKI